MPCRAHEVKKPIFGTVWGGWINGNSVGLDPEKRILGCPSTLLIKNKLIIQFSTPKLRGRVPEVPCRAQEVKKNHFWQHLGGGVDKRKLCRTGP